MLVLSNYKTKGALERIAFFFFGKIVHLIFSWDPGAIHLILEHYSGKNHHWNMLLFLYFEL